MLSLLERVAGALFGGAAGSATETDRQLIEDMTEVIVDIVEPRVRMRSGYQSRLASGVRRTIDHLRVLGREPLEPILLSRAAWSDDPRINSFFATLDDIPVCIGHCQELRRFFDDHPGCQEAHALLGMKREERTVFGPKLEGGVLRQDVAQVTNSFSGHRLLAPGIDAAQTRLEVGRRIMQRLAQLALGRIVALDTKAADLKERKAILYMQQRMLQRARDGMAGLVGDPAATEQQIRDVERQLQEAVEGFIEAKASLATLDGYIGQINEVLVRPEEQVALSRVHLRVNRMGFKVEAGSAEPATDLDLTELSIGEGLRAVVSIVRIPRTEMPPKQDLYAGAERHL